MPEHAEIFARWQREAAAYRAARHATPSSASHTARRRARPSTFSRRGTTTRPPLALFIHGGWWRSLEPSMFQPDRQRARMRTASPSRSPATICARSVSIADIIEQMRAACLFLWRKHRQRILVYGHSAGGHLAACMVATDWKAFAPDAPADLVPAAYAISGVFDLAPLVQVSHEPGPAARRSGRAPRLAAVLAAFRPAAVSMPSSARWSPASSCGRAERSPKRWRRGTAIDPLRGDRRRQPFHRRRSAGRSGQRDDGARGRALAQSSNRLPLQPPNQ